MAQDYKVIRKSSEVHATNGFIIDSLNSNSTVDAPSIHAVNEGKTSIKLNDKKQKNITLSSERVAKPTSTKIQIKDENNGVLSVETTLDNVYIKSKDGTTEINATTLISNLYNLASIGLYTENPKTIFDEVNKYI